MENDMTTFYAIFDNANRILQWYGKAKDKQAAWEQFRNNELGYAEDIPGTCEIGAYHFEEGANAIEIVKELGNLN